MPCAAADPERKAKIAAATRLWWAKRLAEPGGLEEAVASGQRLAKLHPPTRERVERQKASREATIIAGRNPRVWHPPAGYEALNAELRRKKISQAERRRVIAAQVEIDERKRLAAMSPLERQIEKLNRGAVLVERVAMPSRVHEFSLTGSSMA